jgi:tetratricopeptide (TPR) repeat protein
MLRRAAPPPPVSKPPPPKAPSPKPKTLAERIAEVKAVEKATPRAFRTIHDAWRALLVEAKGTPHEAGIERRLELLDSEAALAYRELARPMRALVRGLLDEHRPDEARKRLEAWTVPEELDLDGRHTADLRQELELVAELCGLESRRSELLGAYDGGEITRDPRREFSTFLESPRAHVRAEAEHAVAGARRFRAMQVARLRLARPLAGKPLFGERPGTPGPTERRLAPTQPPGADQVHAAVRACVEAMAAASSRQGFEGKLNEGLALLDRAANASSWYPVTWYLRAEWKYGFLGETVEALADLDQAISVQRNYVEARLARALLLLQVPMEEPAVKELRTLSRALPPPSQEAAARALALAKKKDFAAAALEIRQAMWGMPDDLAFLDRRVERPTAPAWADEAKVETEHYLVRLEIPKDPKDREKPEGGARELGSHLEAARAWFPTLVPGTPRRSGRVEVLVFADEEAYHEFADVDPLDQLNETAGMYLPGRRQVALHEGWSPDFTRQCLVHEAMHEYLDSIGVRVPTWLNEGLADYASGIVLNDGRVSESGRILAHRLEPLQSALAEGWRGIPFATMLREERKDFYGVMRSMQYWQAWSMVHFFRHGKGGVYAPLFDLYVGAMARGERPPQAFTLAFGERSVEDLNREWLDYVAGLR